MRHQAFLRAFSLIAFIPGSLATCIGGELFASQGRPSIGSKTGYELVLRFQDKKQGPTDAEQQAAKKISEAKGAEAKLQTAADFVKKYPKSTLRQQIANSLATEIVNIQDRPLQVSAARTYLEIFTEPAEADSFQPVLIEAHLDNNQIDESFNAADAWIGKHPEELLLRMRLALTGANEAARGNVKFLEKAQQHGMSAIELMEADKRPGSIEASQWTPYKAKWLPVLYREMGVIAIRGSKPAEAKPRLEKAIAHKSLDPTVYAIVGGIADEEYEALAVKYKNSPAGAEADAMLKKAQDQMDKVMELYAQAIALSEGKPEYKQVVDQLTPSLQGYFKFRHNGSTDGLRQLIDKYKTPSATP